MAGLRIAEGLVIGILLAGLVVGGSPSATAKGGEIGGTGQLYLFSDDFGTSASRELIYGRSWDRVLVGDWDGDGRDTLAVRRDRSYHIKNSLTGGAADRVVDYGRDDDVVLVGDWDGDGRDTLAVRRGSLYFFKDDLSGGTADRVVGYGRDDDVVLVGDWDGDGRDTLAVRRGSLYFFKDDLIAGAADRVVGYGRPADVVVVGDWDGNDADSLAVRRENYYFVANGFGGGEADLVVPYGRASDAALVGDWDADGTDTLGLRRPSPVPAQPTSQPPVLAYGTLRSGQSAHSVIGRTVKEALSRAPGLDLYMISGYSFPWAVPNAVNTAGIAGELFWFPSSTYWSDIARLDRYERYDPSRPASDQLYTRERRATSYGVGAWVYVATPRWASIARDRGTRIPSGDYVRW
ncbi:gamma-glutamylcyclotransferase [Georgenia sp. EYE_87]|uniref:gamma-glutamylcyclotransferase family protein n=1 Tax=Georgenia sp. EYE_87 TaxID=2853448 RepID=UPI002005CE76|nr:gamma-glutamylcyclotransferase family protein [Georgenia sp. EYE_87]MCK6211789.1 gamma-glutamylcyclotransferase [Georgenia sp. EYE_87]